MRAIDAKYEAQKIAFSPFVFQTCVAMKELNIFTAIRKYRGKATLEIIKEETKLSKYGVQVLLEMAEAAEIITRSADDQIELTKTGHYVYADMMTHVNMMFTHDVCYKGLFNLTEAIKEGTPAGLRELGNWKTVYEGLSQLPPEVKKSWLEFDHYYSDDAFDDALKIIFEKNPQQIFDIGGNTGKWAIASCKHNESVKVKIIDLPGQIKLAKENINSNTDFGDRVSYHPIDILTQESEIPEGADIYWMSQFLDCFSESEIEHILLKIKKNAKKDASIFIMETFIDNQKYPAAHFSLVATSLYFTAIANGNSKMYAKSTFEYIIEKCGFKIVAQHELIGDSYHTILECKLA